ncbi:hypothetical protein FJ251_02755 [bacterium]|nr:hypothetical protein [bacterium]
MRRTAMVLGLIALLSAGFAQLATAERILDCDFEDQPLDQLIGTGGAAAHQPVDLGGIDAFVRTSPAGGQALEIVDGVDFGALTVRFEFLNSVEITTGVLTLSAVLHFVVDDRYLVYVREQAGAAHSFLNLSFAAGGVVLQGDADDFGMFPVGSYTLDEDLTLVITLDLDAGTCAVSLDGVVIVPAESTGVTGAGVGSILFGFDHDPDLIGDYFIQSVTADWTATAVAVKAFSTVKSAW